MAAPCFTKEEVFKLLEQTKIAEDDLDALAGSYADIPNLPNLAARFGHLDLLKKLPLSRPDKDSYEEKTPLHDACEYGRVRVVTWLVKQPWVNIDHVDSSTWTPAMYAARIGHLAVLKVLRENGADLTVVDENDQNALFIADQNGHDAVCNFLREEGLH